MSFSFCIPLFFSLNGQMWKEWKNAIHFLSRGSYIYIYGTDLLPIARWSLRYKKNLCSFKQIIIGFLVHSLYGFILSFNSFRSINFACVWFLFRFDFYLYLLHPHNSRVLIPDQLTTYFSSSADSLFSPLCQCFLFLLFCKVKSFQFIPIVTSFMQTIHTIRY